MSYPSFNPATGELVKSFDELVHPLTIELGERIGSMGIQEFVNKRLVRTADLTVPV